MLSPEIIEFERTLLTIFRKIDEWLEEHYETKLHLRLGRPERGTTGAPEHDGLFNVGAAFSAGYGSEFGRGYVIEVRILAQEEISPQLHAKIVGEVVERVNAELRIHCGDRLEARQDGNIFKIVGKFIAH